MSRAARWLRALLLYAGLTAVFTWPLVTRLHLMDAGDSALFAWEMAWERQAILHAPACLPHAGFGPNKWARVERDLPSFVARLTEVVRFEEGDVVYELRSP